MELTSSDYLIKQLYNVHKMSAILFHVIFKALLELDTREEQNDVLSTILMEI